MKWQDVGENVMNSFIICPSVLFAPQWSIGPVHNLYSSIYNISMTRSRKVRLYLYVLKFTLPNLSSSLFTFLILFLISFIKMEVCIFCEKSVRWWELFLSWRSYVARNCQLLLVRWRWRNIVVLLWVQWLNPLKFYGEVNTSVIIFMNCVLL
jgi:hypothetical protein